MSKHSPEIRSTAKHDAVRVAALEAVILIEQGQQTDHAVKTVTEGKNFRPIDRRFLLQLVNGTTKMRRRLDHEIKFYLARPAMELPIKLANILRLGFYQLLFTDRVPAASAVSESVNLAHYFVDAKRSKLVNAVMRSRLREPEKVVFADPDKDPTKRLGDIYSYPDYFVRYCLQEFGYDNTEKLLNTYNQPPHVTYRVNYLKAKPEQVAEILDSHDIKYRVGKHLPEYFHILSGGLPLERELIRTGKVYVQDESCGLPVRLLNPKVGGNALDLTAAPGGKATHIAIRMRNKGRVTAVDKSQQRLSAVAENANRLGVTIISPVVADMTEFTCDELERVIIDPPCSGWGTASKNADLRWSKTNEDIKNLAKIQAAMIDRASRLVKPGGILVYSTCTIIRQENDQVIEEFLLRNENFEIDHAQQFVDATITTERGYVKTYPISDGLDGSFCARLRRKLS